MYGKLVCVKTMPFCLFRNVVSSSLPQVNLLIYIIMYDIVTNDIIYLLDNRFFSAFPH